MPQEAFEDQAPPRSSTPPGECGHETRTIYDGVLQWECWVCAHASPREPDGRRERLGQRLDAARHFAESLERRKVSYALSGRS